MVGAVRCSALYCLLAESLGRWRGRWQLVDAPSSVEHAAISTSDTRTQLCCPL